MTSLINGKEIAQNLRNELKKEIDYYKTKILLLGDDDINIDFLEEKSYELGESPENAFTVIIK